MSVLNKKNQFRFTRAFHPGSLHGAGSLAVSTFLQLDVYDAAQKIAEWLKNEAKACVPGGATEFVQEIEIEVSFVVSHKPLQSAKGDG